MFEEKTFTMRMYNEMRDFDSLVKDVDTLSKTGREKEQELMNKTGDRMIAIKNEAIEEARNNELAIYKITYPNLSSSDSAKQTLGKMDKQNAILFNSQHLYEEQILSALDDAIANKEIDFISHVGNKFMSKPDDKIKTQKELDLKYAINNKMKEAFRDTDLDKRYHYKKKLNHELKQIDTYLKELTYGKKRNHHQWLKAVSNL